MKPVSRRQFIHTGALALAGSLLPGTLAFSAANHASAKTPANISGSIFKHTAPDQPWKWSRPADFAVPYSDKTLMCGICPHNCLLDKGDRGICRSRVNIDGILYTLAYGNACSVNIDPIEKKPLFHFKPASRAFSIAAAGCNFRCLNCQNWQISQVTPEVTRFYELFPDQVVAAAVDKNAAAIAYTYSEAVTWFEYMMDTARRARKKNIANLWISNGYINPKPLSELCTVLDAANINLKSFDDAIYQRLNGGRMAPVLDTFKTLHAKNIHFEMTTLVVPGYVDNPKMISHMCRWIIDHLGPDHPLHFLRFFPQYKLDRLPPTPVSLLTQFRQIAMDCGIRYVYVGNVPGHEGNHTWCHGCGKLLIERKGYFMAQNNINGDLCKFCGTRIPGVWG